jgi:hypothetical protein
MRCTVVSKDELRAVCCRAFPMQDTFTRAEKRLARRILDTVIHHKAMDLDDHTIYRRVMDEMQESIPSCPLPEGVQESPAYETFIASIQRMVWASLAILEGSPLP